MTRCEAVVHSTPTEVLAELVRCGVPVKWVAQQYDLTLSRFWARWSASASTPPDDALVQHPLRFFADENVL